MKLSVDNTPVESANLLHQGEFRIKNSAKAFSILSSGLYSNKYQAILRELGCNAYDSHIEAGKPNEPFLVHLPNKLNPVFSIRDYGVGLDNDGVINIYTTYFESTKQNSNDYVGCMGLGSKSPFSYTDTFSITAIKDGVKRLYTAFINEHGIPAIARLAEEATTEGNGVEVSFAVNDQSDMYQFRNEAANVFSWFRTKPTITGQDVVIPEIQFAERDIVPGVHVLKGDQYNYRHGGRSYALMGNVHYPIKLPEQSKDSDDEEADENSRKNQIRKMLDNGRLVIEFKIGELDVAASREELSYIPHTIESIYARGEEVIKHLGEYIARELKGQTTKWERHRVLERIYKSNTSLFGPAIVDYVKQNPKLFFKHFQASLYGLKTYIALKDIRRISADLHDHMSFYKLDTRYADNGVIAHAVREMFIPTSPTPNEAGYEIDADVQVVLQDDRGGLLARIKQGHKANKLGKHILAFRLTDKEADREKIYKRLLNVLGNPTTVVYSSSLPKVPSVSSAKDTMIVYKFKVRQDRYNERNYKFIPDLNVASLPKALKDKHLYLPLNNASIMISKLGSVTFTASEFRNEISMRGIDKFLGVNMDNVYALNKTTLSRHKNKGDWVNFFDYLKEKFAAIDWNVVKEEVKKKYITSHVCEGSYDFKKAPAKDLARIKDNDSPFGRLVKLFLDNRDRKMDEAIDYSRIIDFMKMMSGMTNVDDLENLKKSINIDSIDQGLGKLFEEVNTLYPMLKHLELNNHWQAAEQWKDAIEYVALVDTKVG